MIQTLKVCPTCKRSLVDGPQRICGNCGKSIRRPDHWHFEAGRCVHNDCAEPLNYVENHAVQETEPILFKAL